MFGATFNLVKSVGLPYFLENQKNGSLKINNFPSNNCFSYRNVFQNGVNAKSKIGLKELDFLLKSSNFVHFKLYDLVQISPACSPKTYQIIKGETLDLRC